VTDRTADGGRREADESEVSRRNAVKSFSLVGLAAALDVTLPQLERATHALAELSQQQPALTPKFFSRHEWQTVRVLVDYVIPRDDRSGSATDAKVPEFMDFLLADKDASENARTSMRGGLAWMDEEAQHRFSKTFVAATDAQRRQILDDIAWPAKAPIGLSHGVAFFTRFRDMTASGFFSTYAGWQDVKYMGNVFNHWDGCPPAALDKLGVSYNLMKSKAGQ